MDKKLDYLGMQLSGCDMHVKDLSERIAQTPIEGVIYTGARGRSDCYPVSAEERRFLRKEGGQEFVSYNRSAEPDFTPFAKVEVQISNMSEERYKNFSSANEKLLKTDWAKERNLVSKSDIKKYCSQNQLTWHEKSNGITMQLVPTRINANYGHSGGVAEFSPENKEIALSDGILRNSGKISAQTAIKIKKSVVGGQEKVEEIHERLSENINFDIDKTEVCEKAMIGSIIPIMMYGIHDIVSVSMGEMSTEEALQDFAKTSKDIVVGNIIYESVSYVGNQIGTSELIQKLIKPECLGPLVACGVIIANDMILYTSGKITEEKLFVDLTDKGVNMAIQWIIKKAVGEAIFLQHLVECCM